MARTRPDCVVYNMAHAFIQYFLASQYHVATHRIGGCTSSNEQSTTVDGSGGVVDVRVCRPNPATEYGVYQEDHTIHCPQGDGEGGDSGPIGVLRRPD